MTSDNDDIESQPDIPEDSLSQPTIDAAIAVVIATSGLAFGPIGAVIAAMLGPFGKHVVDRFKQLWSVVDEAGFDQDDLVDRLNQDEALAQLLARVVQGVVESELAAKRLLLAQAAVRALGDDAEVDVEARLVRTAVDVDTVDVRVLNIIYRSRKRMKERVPQEWQSVESARIIEIWPGVERVLVAVTANLVSLGLVHGTGAWDGGDAGLWNLTEFGEAFIEELRSLGLEEELKRRSS